MEQHERDKEKLLKYCKRIIENEPENQELVSNVKKVRHILENSD